MIECMIKDSTPEQRADFIREGMEYLRKHEPETFSVLQGLMYDCIYGLHFNEWSYENAVSKLKNRDGTEGAHWSLEEIGEIPSGKPYNRYDFAYVMNMMYSDYYGSVPNDTDTYRKMAYAFLDDVDAPKGKAWLYHDAMSD